MLYNIQSRETPVTLLIRSFLLVFIAATVVLAQQHCSGIEQ